MKFYLAARYPRKEEMLEAAKEIQSRLGWSCTSSWVKGSEEGKLRKEIAVYDLEDVKDSDYLILFSYPRGEPKPGGGRFVEFGYALGQGKPCAVIGHYENVFCHHPDVSVYPTLEDFILEFEVR
jgi:nucleoside 2-deoxyribosyltransferase